MAPTTSAQAYEKDLGILLYIDDHPSMYEEFSWIYKSWIHSGVWRRSDLIVVCHPKAYDQLPGNDPGVIKIVAEPISREGRWKGYHFINSIACVSGAHTAHLAGQYKWLLRTDADVFLTRHLANFRPNFPVLGRGRYAENQEVWDRMVAFCKAHGVAHQRSFGCGSSILAESSLALFFLERQTYWCERLLEHFDAHGEGQWPGWFKGVITLYAGEIAANENHHAFLRYSYQRILDLESYVVGHIDEFTLHIHAIHTDDYFSKSKFRDGGYKHIDVAKLDTSKVNQYAHWIAATPLDEIKAAAAYPY